LVRQKELPVDSSPPLAESSHDVEDSFGCTRQTLLCLGCGSASTSANL